MKLTFHPPRSSLSLIRYITSFWNLIDIAVFLLIFTAFFFDIHSKMLTPAEFGTEVNPSSTTDANSWYESCHSERKERPKRQSRQGHRSMALWQRPTMR